MPKSYERELGEISQKLDNLHEKIDTVDGKVTYTNGKIASTMRDIQALQLTQNSCPARKYFSDTPGKFEEKKFNWQTGLVITNLILMVMFFILNFIKPIFFK